MSSPLEPVKYERKCENWLKTFAEWAIPRSEAPETFIFWTGLFTLSSVMRRRVQVPKKLLGSWAAAPNLYIIFVAPPAKARKSTTAGYAEDLLDEVRGIEHASSSMTQAVLMNKLSTADENAVTILSSEFATFIMKSGLDMFDFLTDLFDGKKKVSAETISRGFEFADKPCINLLAATTPEWISTGMPESVIGGGFASRVIFVYEDRVRRRKLFYEDLDHTHLNKLRDDLIADLRHLSTNIKGDFDIEPGAKKFLEDWYKETADKLPPEQYRLHGYYERKPAHVLKVAQLVHLARSDSLLLERADIDVALALLAQIEVKLPQAFQQIGKNKYTVDMNRIAEFIEEKEKVEHNDLFRNFYSVATPNLLQELITGLIQIGDVGTEMTGGKLYYVYKG